MTESGESFNNHDIGSELLQQVINRLIVSHARAIEEKLHGRIILEISYQDGKLQHAFEDYRRRMT